MTESDTPVVSEQETESTDTTGGETRAAAVCPSDTQNLIDYRNVH
jgi:hypothetical protein